MTITKQAVANKLADYLHHAISLEELVAWTEAAMLEGDFEERATCGSQERRLDERFGK